jgi:hypothetical protein
LLKVDNVKEVECDVKGGKVTVTMHGAKALTKASVETAFKGTKYCVTSVSEKKSPALRSAPPGGS